MRGTCESTLLLRIAVVTTRVGVWGRVYALLLGSLSRWSLISLLVLGLRVLPLSMSQILLLGLSRERARCLLVSIT